jgi:hypothetical protein
MKILELTNLCEKSSAQLTGNIVRLLEEAEQIDKAVSLSVHSTKASFGVDKRRKKSLKV